VKAKTHAKRKATTHKGKPKATHAAKPKTDAKRGAKKSPSRKNLSSRRGRS
jgi:hypothetical protein